MNKEVIFTMSDRDVDKTIKIAGTNNDRRRKVTEKKIEKARKLYKKGKSLYYIADKLKVSHFTVRLYVDEVFEQSWKAKRKLAPSYGNVASCKSKPHAEVVKERADYKRTLVAQGKVTI